MVTPGRLLRLELEGGDVIIWIVIHTLNDIWKQRKTGKRSKSEKCISLSLADALVMKETKFSTLACDIESKVMAFHF